MHVESIELYDFPELGRRNRIQIDCDEKVNLLVGPNAVGKSTILRELYNQFVPRPQEEDDVDEGEDDDIDEQERLFSFSGSSDWALGVDGKPALAEVPLLNVPAVRSPITDYELPGNDEEELDYDQYDHGFRIVIGDEVLNGAYFLNQTRIPSVNRTEFENTVRKCFNDIGPEVLNHINIEVTYDLRGTTAKRFVLSKDNNSTPMEDVDTAEVPVYFTSSGTHRTLQWICTLALMVARAYHWEQGWENKPAILLIDEIENHLHPTWQRRIIPALLEHFPRLQIFATTHSPFVVAGLKTGQVHLLKRNEDGVVTATTNTEDIIGWTADKISREMLEIIDPVDEETAKNSARLRKLRQEGPRADAESENERQKEMQELRNLVNLDSLAGGPRAARRELFEQLFAERKMGENLN